MLRNIVGLVAMACFSTTTLASDGPSLESEYSAKPLSNPVRDVAQNSVEFAQFNDWLNANYDSVPEDRKRSLMEHLYSIIDSHVKHTYERDGVLRPVGDEILLPMCFMWATRMGVFGAHSVLAELDPDTAKTLTSPIDVPESFQINFRSDMLNLSSAWGDWTATFPYWFMVGDLKQMRAGNGLRTQLAIISTGFGQHSADDGHSQATIMIVYSPEGHGHEFRDFWLEMFKLSSADGASDELHGMTAYRRFDAPTRMHTEVVFPQVARGAMAVGYMGLAGTYEHNRQHFADFLAAMKLGPGG